MVLLASLDDGFVCPPQGSELEVGQKVMNAVLAGCMVNTQVLLPEVVKLKVVRVPWMVPSRDPSNVCPANFTPVFEVPDGASK